MPMYQTPPSFMIRSYYDPPANVRIREAQSPAALCNSRTGSDVTSRCSARSSTEHRLQKRGGMVALLFIVCVVGALALGVYIVRLSQQREPKPSAPSPPAPSPQHAAPRRVARDADGRVCLPGMPPRRAEPEPAEVAAVEGEPEPGRRAARGSVPPRPVGGYSFDDVVTAGAPVITPQIRQQYSEDDWADD